MQLASSGSLNVRAHLPAVYIQKIVVDPTKILAFSGGQGAEGKGKAKGGKSGVTLATSYAKPGGKGSSGVTLALFASAPGSGVILAPAVDPASESGTAPMEVDEGAVIPAKGPPPSDRSWLPLCDDKGEFFESETTFRGVDDWIKERGIIFPCGYRAAEGFVVDEWRDENAPSGSLYRGTL